MLYWFALLPPDRNALDSKPDCGEPLDIACSPPCLRGYPVGSLVSCTIKTCCLVNFPVSALDWLRSEIGPRALYVGCSLILRDGLDAESFTMLYI